MEDGTLVFPLMAKNEAEDVCSMIIRLTDSGSARAFSEGMSPAECLNPASPSGRDHFIWLLTERVARGCRRRVTWGQRGRRPSGHSQACGPSQNRSGVSQKESLRVDALITATIEGRKVMLCTQRGYASGEKRTTAFCLWVTDSNRTFSVGPVAVENAANRMAVCIFYNGGALVRAVSFHFPARRRS
ncbi:trans-sialidase [Trypanosoma cruzi]|nr:trans-sialidase [Trypanosoma cruzi]